VSDTDRHFIVALALGPVGAFIAGGRRSRDLWYGSRLLSEMTRQAAVALDGTGRTTLIIPLKESLHDFWREKYRGPVITNKILAQVHAKDEAQVRADLEAARAAVFSFLASEVDALAKDPNWTKEIQVDKNALLAQGQAIAQGDFVEFYAAWTPIEGEETAAVEQARNVLLAGRKAARIFPAPTWTKEGRPKCSLDPGRDSVMVEMDPAAHPERQDWALESAETLLDRMERGIRKDERLDAIGLLRRRAAIKEMEVAGGGGGGPLNRYE